MAQARKLHMPPQAQNDTSEQFAWLGEPGRNIGESIYNPMRAGKEHLGSLIILVFSATGAAAQATNSLATTTLIRHYFDGGADAATNLRSALAAADSAVNALDKADQQRNIPGLIAVSISGRRAFVACNSKSYFVRAHGDTLDAPVEVSGQSDTAIAPGDSLFVITDTAPTAAHQQSATARLRTSLAGAARELSSPVHHQAVLAVRLPALAATPAALPGLPSWLVWAGLALVITLLAAGWFLRKELKNPFAPSATVIPQSTSLAMSPSASARVAGGAPVAPAQTFVSATKLPTITPPPTPSRTPTLPASPTRSPTVPAATAPPANTPLPIREAIATPTATLTPEPAAAPVPPVEAIATPTATLTPEPAAAPVPPVEAIATPTDTATPISAPASNPSSTPHVTQDGNADKEKVPQGGTISFEAQGFLSNELLTTWVTPLPPQGLPITLDPHKATPDGRVTWSWTVLPHYVTGPWRMVVGNGRRQVFIDFEVTPLEKP